MYSKFLRDSSQKHGLALLKQSNGSSKNLLNGGYLDFVWMNSCFIQCLLNSCFADVTIGVLSEEQLSESHRSRKKFDTTVTAQGRLNCEGCLVFTETHLLSFSRDAGRLRVQILNFVIILVSSRSDFYSLFWTQTARFYVQPVNFKRLRDTSLHQSVKRTRKSHKGRLALQADCCPVESWLIHPYFTPRYTGNI